MSDVIGTVVIKEKNFTIGGKVFLLKELPLRQYNKAVKLLHEVHGRIRELVNEGGELSAYERTEITNAVWAEKNITARIAAIVLVPEEPMNEEEMLEFFENLEEKKALLEAVNFFMSGEGGSMSIGILTYLFSPKKSEG